MSIHSILIIDDSEADRYLLKRLLRKANIGRTVFEAKDGQEAIDLLEDFEAQTKKNPEDFPPVLIFLDINMPGMSGFEFLEVFESVREKHAYKSMLLMLSSSLRREEREKALSYEFVKGFLEKMPATAEDLLQQVEKTTGLAP